MSLHEDGVSLSAGRTPLPLQLPSLLPFPASLLSSFLLFPLHLDLVSLSLSQARARRETITRELNFQALQDLP